MVGDERVSGDVQSDGCTLRLKLLLDKSASYTIHLVNASGYSDPEPRSDRIEEGEQSPRIGTDGIRMY
jgi:hypothetical protein